MKHIKPFNVNENYAPDAGTHGAVSIILDDQEVNMFGINEYNGQPLNPQDDDMSIIVPELKILLDTNKVSIDNNELWFYEDDRLTKKVLKRYFDLKRY